MPLGITKLSNEYASLVQGIDAPKAVWMAIAVALAHRLEGHDDFSRVERILMEEWSYLHANGIVPQKPKRIQGDRG
jgi:hypothetical protein